MKSKLLLSVPTLDLSSSHLDACSNRIHFEQKFEHPLVQLELTAVTSLARKVVALSYGRLSPDYLAF